MDADGRLRGDRPIRSDERFGTRSGAADRRDERPKAIDRIDSCPGADVLVIGAGLAGQRAALAAAEEGVSVAIVSGPPGPLALNAAQGGINATLNRRTPGSRTPSTVKGSDYLGDQDAIAIMCQEAPEEILHLEHLGVPFHRNEEGKLGTRAFGGASQARTYYVADITGRRSCTSSTSS